jgi:hypothetical protein
MSDHCEADEGSYGCGVAFEVARQTAISTGPGEGPLDDPSLWHDDEAANAPALDDLDLPASCGAERLGHFRSLISCVGEDAFDKRKTQSHAGQQIAHAVAVLNVGGQNFHAEQKAERVNEDMALAARDFLARIEALWVERRASFWAALPVWLSIIAAVGLARVPPPRALFHKAALRTSRSSIELLRPPLRAGGIMGATSAHSVSLMSLA